MLLIVFLLAWSLHATQTHVVKKGETLSDIAKKHQSSVRAIVDANGLKGADKIYVGQKLSIPFEAKEHKVTKGQTLSQVAGKYGVSVDQLVKWNALKSKNAINEGQVLKVSGPPTASAAPKAESVFHLVKKGESLGTIADANGIKLSELASLNGIKKPYTIYPGQRLTVREVAKPVGTATSSAPKGNRPKETIRIIVRKNQTLGQIAERYGVTERQLAAYNGIKNPDKIRIGQRLIIPGKGAAPKIALSSSVKSKLDKTSIRTGRWKYVVVHHSAAEKSKVSGMEYYHRKVRRMENGLAYHFVIGNGKAGDLKDGEIYLGPRWTKQINGGHLAKESLNAKALGICLVGNFQEKRPSAAQMKSLNALVDYLLARCRLKADAVKTHSTIHRGHTACPGKLFPTSAFLADVKKRN